MFLKPARPDLKVLDPATMQPLPAQGAEKEPSAYWTRRILDGDVLEAVAVNPKAQARRAVAEEALATDKEAR